MGNVFGQIGPFDLDFDVAVYTYLSNSPPQDDASCLRQFFRSLQTAGVAVHHRRFSDGQIVAVTCNHLIWLQAKRGGHARVYNVGPAFKP